MCIHNTDSTSNCKFRCLLRKFFIPVYKNLFNQQKDLSHHSLSKSHTGKKSCSLIILDLETRSQTEGYSTVNHFMSI